MSLHTIYYWPDGTVAHNEDQKRFVMQAHKVGEPNSILVPHVTPAKKWRKLVNAAIAQDAEDMEIFDDEADDVADLTRFVPD